MGRWWCQETVRCLDFSQGLQTLLQSGQAFHMQVCFIRGSRMDQVCICFQRHKVPLLVWRSYTLGDQLDDLPSYLLFGFCSGTFWARHEIYRPSKRVCSVRAFGAGRLFSSCSICKTISCVVVTEYLLSLSCNSRLRLIITFQGHPMGAHLCGACSRSIIDLPVSKELQNWK